MQETEQNGLTNAKEAILAEMETELWASRLMKESAEACFEPVEVQEGMMHLVQNRREVAEILELEIPPESYYEELHMILAAKFEGADPDLVEHAVSLTHAFDTATAFALS